MAVGAFQADPLESDFTAVGTRVVVPERAHQNIVVVEHDFSRPVPDEQCRHVEVPIGKSGKSLGLDYSYRDTNPFDGTHSFGLVFKL